MPGRVFLFFLIILIPLAILTSPPLLTRLWAKPTPTATPAPTTIPSPTATLDPFAAVPTATPLGRGLNALPTPESTLTFEPTNSITGLLPDTLATPQPLTDSTALPPVPTPAGAPPERLHIPRLGLEVAIEPVGMVPSSVAPGVFEWAVPDYRAAGWLKTSAPFGQEGNTVLAGHHNIKGEVFRDLWTLERGDEIRLTGGDRARTYIVEDVLILPERDQPLARRLANAGYIQPTEDERLTLVTCWPYEDNSHRTVVVARPGDDHSR